MSPFFRKLALTGHITSSVGWLGAVTGFLALAVAGLTSKDTEMVRAAYFAMEFTAYFVIVPLSLASPVTGIVQSLGTTWGLFRHYWVMIKFLITIPATILLLVHMQPIGHLARVVGETTLASGTLAGLRIRLVADAGAALIVLLVATTLSVYKPWGMTPYGRRKQQRGSSQRPYPDTNGETSVGTKRGLIVGRQLPMKIFGVIVLILVLLFIFLHLSRGGLGGH